MEDFKLESVYDGRRISITPAVARLSKVIRDKLEAKAAGYNIYPANKKEIVIKLHTRSEHLEKIIEWCEHHKDDPLNKEEKEDKDVDPFRPFEADIPSWDMGFFKANERAVKGLENAAFALNIEVMENYAGDFLMYLLMIKELEDYRRLTHNEPLYVIVTDPDAA